MSIHNLGVLCGSDVRGLPVRDMSSGLAKHQHRNKLQSRFPADFTVFTGKPILPAEPGLSQALDVTLIESEAADLLEFYRHAEAMLIRMPDYLGTRTYRNPATGTFLGITAASIGWAV